jgi:hypothetical protein
MFDVKKIIYLKKNLDLKDLDSNNIVFVPNLLSDSGIFVPAFQSEEAKKHYLDWYKKGFWKQDNVWFCKNFVLGQTQFLKCNHNGLDFFVANMLCKKGLGGVRSLRYNSFSRCMDLLVSFCVKNNFNLLKVEVKINSGSFEQEVNRQFIENLLFDCLIEKGLQVKVYL